LPGLEHKWQRCRAAKIELQLVQEEAALRQRLLQVLPSASQCGLDLFTNSQFNPHGLNTARLSPASQEFVRSSRQCIAWREALGLPAKRSVGQLFLAACEERAGSSEHRRGPRRLSAWLLVELQSAA
jgi:hypothetical protein